MLSPVASVLPLFTHTILPEKCPYCDFNTYGISARKLREGVEAAYAAALVRELGCYAADASWRGRSVHTIYFGGGTPSLLSPCAIEMIMASIRDSFTLADGCEVTLEVNPGSLEGAAEERLSAIRECGVTRLSLGIQSFNARKLTALGRIHSAEESRNVISSLTKHGFNSFSLDLMFGVSEETEEDWCSDLREALSYSPEHLSVYGLTIEPGTVFEKLTRRGKTQSADEDVQARLFRIASETIQGAGLVQYEVSNYARPGCESRHNMNYWKGGDYLGLGAGAHSYCRDGAPNGLRWHNELRPERYCELVSLSGFAVAEREELTCEQVMLELLFLKLRTQQWVAFGDYERIMGQAPGAEFLLVVECAVGAGLLEVGEGVFRSTPAGWLVLDNTLAELAASW